MPTAAPYTAGFFDAIESGSLASARAVVPFLITLLQPLSVVDVGCGTGAWLAVFRENGVQDFLGIDGDYVDARTLRIARDRFRAADISVPLILDRRFDLVLSLEVAEHLPSARASAYVDNLTKLGDRIVFSAAIPNQGGTGHVNEQWPEYWRALFEARGFVLIDCLRHRFWNHRDVERWYRQNLLLYVRKSLLDESSALKKEWREAQGRALSLVHPATYLAPSLRQLLRMVPRALWRGLVRRLERSS